MADESNEVLENQAPGAEDEEPEFSLVSEAFVVGQFEDLGPQSIWEYQDRATAMVAEYLRTSFSEETYEDEVVDFKKKAVTKHLPITGVVKVEDISGDEPTELFEGDDFLVYPTHIVFTGDVAYQPKGLRITYMAGLTRDQVPTVFKLVAEDLIRFWAFKEDKRDELFYKKEDMEDRSYEMKTINESQILSRLARYRYFPFGTIRKGNVRIGVI